MCLGDNDGNTGHNRNNSRSLVWGRSYEETRPIAVALAERLALPLKSSPDKSCPSGIISFG